MTSKNIIYKNVNFFNNLDNDNSTNTHISEIEELEKY